MSEQRVDRAVGAVVGSAVGDALGAPFEFGPAGQYTARFPAPVLSGVGEMAGGGGFGWSPGEFTDDTQMAIVQAESLLACGGFDGADLFERFRVWAADAPDVGVQTRAALRSGLPWHRAAAEFYERSGRAAGNGSIMRAAPTAVWASALPEQQSDELARAVAALTHGDPAAGWGTVILHRLITTALHGNDPWAAIDDAVAALPVGQERFAEMLAADWSPTATTLPNGTVWTCLAQAVWAVRRATCFEDAVTAAIDLGDDTDTVAAVAGGLAGALWGAAAIPPRWTAPLHGHVTTSDGRRTYAHADLVTLTERLLTARPTHDWRSRS
ncbi:MAG: ADP-ribosylglycohydrolase family protein [Ilumatobacteraceae bacterium]